MRFYEFEEGQILIDGRDIRDYTYKELRDKIGLDLQDPFMFYGTIADNIRLLNPDITDEEMIHAAKFVQADQFIDRKSTRLNSSHVSNSYVVFCLKKQI